MTRLRTLLVAIAIGSMALTSGCAPEPEGVPDASPIEEPAPSTTPVADDPAPTPLLDLPCADLLPGGVGGGLLIERLPPLEYSTAHLYESFPRPDGFATEQARGTYCTRSNGEPRLVDDVANPASVSIEARIIPNAAAQFAVYQQFSATGTEPGESAISCISGTPETCLLDFLVDEHWVSFLFWGVTPGAGSAALGRPPQLEEIAAAVSDIVANAPQSEQSWSAPAETVPLGTDCEQFFTPDRIASDLGITDQLYFGPYEDYESAERTGRELAPALSCPWQENSNRGVGGHSVLQGGAWALQLLESEGEFDGWDTLDLTGLAEQDSASYSCTDDDGGCLANVVIGHNWVQLQVLTEPNGLDAAGATELLQRYTQSAVDSIRS